MIESQFEIRFHEFNRFFRCFDFDELCELSAGRFRFLDADRGSHRPAKRN